MGIKHKNFVFDHLVDIRDVAARTDLIDFKRYLMAYSSETWKDTDLGQPSKVIASVKLMQSYGRS